MAIKNAKFPLLLQLVSENADATLQDLGDYISRQVPFSNAYGTAPADSLPEISAPSAIRKGAALRQQTAVAPGLRKTIKTAWH